MGISRRFQICLLFSLIGHSLCFCLVTIIFPPAGFKNNRCPAVNFLGPILPPEQKITAQTPLKSFAKKLDKECIVSLPGFIAPLLLPIEQTVSNPANIIGAIEKDIAGGDSFKKLSVHTTEAVPNLLQREIIFQPPFPKYYALNEPLSPKNAAIFKINVSPDGTIEKITSMKLSGNPEMDTILARYIKKWRFAPAWTQGSRQQIVKINIRTETSCITACDKE